MSNPTTDLVACREGTRSHPDSLRWRAYYAAFEVKHGRPSGNDELDPKLSQLIHAVFGVLQTGMSEVLK